MKNFGTILDNIRPLQESLPFFRIWMIFFRKYVT